MSLQIAKSLLGVGSQLLRRVSSVHRVVGASGVRHWGVSERSLARSMWHMCHKNAGVLQVSGCSNTCQCCAVHTQDGKALNLLSEFLTTEIKNEVELEKKLPSINGFELTKSGASEVEFTRKTDNETLEVLFNINNTVSDLGTPEVEESDAPPQLLSRPPFTVRLTKGDEVLAFNLSFPEPVSDEGDSEEPYEDAILIENVSLLSKGEEWDDSSYTLMGVDMDGTMYDFLLDTLDERGITDKFLEELVEFSTTYEHKKYVSFLKNLKGFCGN